MATAGDSPGMIPVERAELVTRDMDEVSALIRDLYIEHDASFSCPDPAKVEGVVRSATASGLNASLLRYGGFDYSAEVQPVNPPMAVMCTGGSGVITTAREGLHVGRGDVFLAPTELRTSTKVDRGAHVSLQVPWGALRSRAGERDGVPTAGLRFTAMAPISAAAKVVFARTAEFICGQLVTSGVTETHPLVVQELTALAATVFLDTFPNSTMTAAYLPGPGWVPTATVRRAAGFMEAHAGQPITLDEIAAAAGVTGRALQYAFLRHFGITPTRYLRRIRLERAHQDLASAGPVSGLTVKATAHRWGWASQSRFTVAYQQRFGVLPSHTLRS